MDKKLKKLPGPSGLKPKKSVLSSPFKFRCGATTLSESKCEAKFQEEKQLWQHIHQRHPDWEDPKHPFPNNFDFMNLQNGLLERLRTKQIDSPLYLQKMFLPQYKLGKDILAISPATSGKTTAIIIAVAETVSGKNKKCQVGILAESNEKAEQIKRDFHQIANYHPGNEVVHAYNCATAILKKDVDAGIQVIIGTPQTVLATIDKIDISAVEALIIDDAEKVTETETKLKVVVEIYNHKKLSRNIRTSILTTTLSENVYKLSKSHMKKDKEVKIVMQEKDVAGKSPSSSN